jgi:ABC-type branched-subunit amino acid transport system ATPase component/ABC-type branched-subunit amino acid transport system permease subunit|uniref:branched-chain amino acid ABC transporter ATP-binding protein/permease n=1 Tax=Candidatus Planktophila sp. TaxID=2175601 RepID=UPI0040496073
MISTIKGLNRLFITASILSIVLLYLFPVLIKSSNNPSFYLQVVSVAVCSAILTISLNICMGYGGLLSLMHTGIQMVGGYAVAILAVKQGWNGWLALVAAAVIGAIFAILVILISLRATYLYFGMITLAVNLIAMEAVRHGGEFTGGYNGLFGVFAPGIPSGMMSAEGFYRVMITILILAYIVQRNLIFSGFGRNTMALRESSETATALGISPNMHRVKVFGVSGALAGLAGGLLSIQIGYAIADIGDLSNGLIFFVGLFLGGVGTLAGPVLGVALVAVIDFVIRGTGQYRTLVLGSILLLTMIILPRGIVGTYRASRYGSPRSREVMPGEADNFHLDIAVKNVTKGEVLLEAHDVVKHFGGVQAVDGISVQFKAGEIHGIIGPNGSGKSTLISALTRYHELTSGRVTLLGAEADKKAYKVARDGVTRVFQIPHLFERVSVLDNVLTGMYRRDKYSIFDAILRTPRYLKANSRSVAEAKALLSLAGMLGMEELAAGSISHGQKRLLEVIRAVATEPKILILDEPATGLTQEEMHSLTSLIRTLAAGGMCVVLIEHNVAFLMDLADIVTVIQSGKVIAEGTPQAVQKDERVLEAYLGNTDFSKELA